MKKLEGRLFVTSDLYNQNIYYIRNSDFKFARIRKLDGKWEVYNYIFKYQIYRKTLKSSLELIENSFKRWFYEVQ